MTSAGSITAETLCFPVSATRTRSIKATRLSMTRIFPGRVSSGILFLTTRPMVWLDWARARNSSESILSRTRLLMRQNRATSLTGLVRKSSAPASSPRTRSSNWSRAVTMMTGICCVVASALRRLHTSMPSMPGIITSSSTMSGLARCTASSASTPFMAVTTSKYSAESLASSKRTLARMSSTTRMRAVILACRGNCQWF